MLIDLDKACRWLVEHSYNSDTQDGITCTSVMTERTLIEDFRKAMRISGNNEEIPSNSCNSDKNLQELTWRTDTPPVDTEVVCKIKGVPYTEYFVCKWDGKHWWHWNFFNSEIQGWFGLNGGWEVEAWKEI